jgi:hypothetical protein
MQGAGIYIPYNEYVHITQRVAYTWDMVIANFGGLLEFWIGAGLVSFLHMALFVGEKVFEFHTHTHTTNLDFILNNT